MKTRIAVKNITFKLRDVQQLAEQQNLAAVTMEEWAAACRHVKAVGEVYTSRKHQMDNVMERTIINADDGDDDDDNDGTSDSTISCDDDDIRGGVLTSYKRFAGTHCILDFLHLLTSGTREADSSVPAFR